MRTQPLVLASLWNLVSAEVDVTAIRDQLRYSEASARLCELRPQALI